MCRNNRKVNQGSTKRRDFGTIGRVTFLESHMVRDVEPQNATVGVLDDSLSSAI